MSRLSFLFVATILLFFAVGACSQGPVSQEATQESTTQEKTQEASAETATTEPTVEQQTEPVVESASEPDPEPGKEPDKEPAPEPKPEPVQEPAQETQPDEPQFTEPGPAEVVVEDASTPKESGPEAPPQDGALPKDCAAVLALFKKELQSIQTCDKDSDCGKVLTGTSCGCTRNKVANKSADTTRFYAIIKHAQANQCSLPLVSTCDCPRTNGFKCVQKQCTWNYVR